jgi:hypothetical protein
MFCFCTIFCEACVFYDVWAFASQIFFKGDTKSPHFFNQLFKNVLHEKLNDWKMTSKKPCIFLFLHDLFAICGFSQCPPHGWLCTYTVLYLGKSQYCWWLGRRVLAITSGLAQVQHWRDFIRWLGQSIPPYTSSPPFSPKGRGTICIL